MTSSRTEMFISWTDFFSFCEWNVIRWDRVIWVELLADDAAVFQCTSSPVAERTELIHDNVQWLEAVGSIPENILSD